MSWIIVFTHFPFYNSGSVYGSDIIQRSVLVPIFEEFGVDIVFSGHEHVYERTYPIRSEIVTDADPGSYKDSQGIIFVVTGGGGRDLYSFSSEIPAWSAYREAIHNYVKVSVSESMLLVETIGVDKRDTSGVIDSFIITKMSK